MKCGEKKRSLWTKYVVIKDNILCSLGVLRFIALFREETDLGFR